MTTTYYYVSYGKPPRPPLWRYLLLGLLLMLAVALAAGIGYGIYELASGGGSQAPVANAPAAEPSTLATELSELHRGGETTYFMVDNGINALEFNSLGIPEALLALEPFKGDQQTPSSVRLVPFTEATKDPSPFEFETDAAEAEQKWLIAVRELRLQDRPSYIYDVVATAHNKLVELGIDNGNVIILITDGLDGGYAISDVEAIGLCPDEVMAAPDDVCGPMLETFVADVDRLVPCPLELGAPPDFVCHPKSAAGAADADSDYDPLHPESLMPCPPELGGAGAICYDRVVDYLPFSRDAIVPCPPELGAPPGKACAELHSKTTEEELLAMIAGSTVPNLRVHVIGLGDREDHEFLRLLAVAGNGEYIYCSARGCDSP